MPTTHIEKAAHRLADILCDIAVDLRTADHDEWRNADDMLQATLNNIGYDFNNNDQANTDRMTLHVRNLGYAALAKFELQRFSLEDGDTVAIYGDWNDVSLELLEAISAGMKEAHPGKRINIVAFDKGLSMHRRTQVRSGA